MPDALVLQGILWAQEHPAAIINNRTLGVNEEAKVRVGKTNVTIRCLAIQQDSVRIRLVGSGDQEGAVVPINEVLSEITQVA